MGRRPRSVYSITPAGRAALQAWLDEPGAVAALEFEALGKVFFAEQGSNKQLVALPRHGPLLGDVGPGGRRRVARRFRAAPPAPGAFEAVVARARGRLTPE